MLSAVCGCFYRFPHCWVPYLFNHNPVIVCAQGFVLASLSSYCLSSCLGVQALLACLMQNWMSCTNWHSTSVSGFEVYCFRLLDFLFLWWWFNYPWSKTVRYFWWKGSWSCMATVVGLSIPSVSACPSKIDLSFSACVGLWPLFRNLFLSSISYRTLPRMQMITDVHS